MFNRFNHWRRLMATLEDISKAISELPAAVAAAVVAALPQQPTIDAAAIEAAINAGFAALTAEIKTNVEGAAHAPTDAATSA
jgi:hypothetical protein